MRCETCKLDFPEDQFNWRNKPQRIRKKCCRTCDRVIRKRCYIKHRQKQIADVKTRKKLIATEFVQWKADNCKCGFCSESDPACLDFHHRNPSEKFDTISNLKYKGSRIRLEREIAKCDVLCKNCHAKLHAYGKL